MSCVDTPAASSREVSPLTALSAGLGRPGADGDLLIASNWIEPAPGQEWATHHHPEHELLWGVDGTVAVDIGGERLTVPPFYGLWIPSGRAHRVVNVSATRLTCTWMSSEYTPWSGREVVTLSLSPLLRDMLAHLRLSDAPPTDSMRARRRRAELFAFDLLDGELDAAWSLPQPTSPQLAALADAMLASPEQEWTVPRAAGFARMSERTLRRRFQAETGMGFAQWRRRQRVHTAIGHLQRGATVAAVAKLLGYRSTSAFGHAYRSVTGHAPAEHIRRMGR